MSPSVAAERFVDAIVAQVDLNTIAASDIGLARALGLYGFMPSKGPIRTADVDRFIDAQLIIAESVRLKINPAADLVKKTWLEVANRRGGTEKFHKWLTQHGITEEWVRRMVSSAVRHSYFVQLRFTRFVFIPEAEMTRALGPGRHGSEERERIRKALRQKRAEQDLARWLEEQRKRAKIRRFSDGEVPDPLAPNRTLKKSTSGVLGREASSRTGVRSGGFALSGWGSVRGVHGVARMGLARCRQGARRRADTRSAPPLHRHAKSDNLL